MNALFQLPFPLLDALPAAAEASGGDEAYTPPWLIEAARETLGAIDLDPASCHAAQGLVRAATWYGVAQDGLAQPWCGRVWLNPPFSDSLPWVERALRCWRAGDVTAALLLVRGDPSTAYSRLLARDAPGVCFLERVDFWPRRINAKTGKPSSPDFPVMQSIAFVRCSIAMARYARIAARSLRLRCPLATTLKGTSMAAARPPSVGDEYDRFDAAFKSARIPTQLYEAMCDIWVDDPARAQHLIARFKDYPPTPAVRFKASDPIDAAYQQLRTAHTKGDAGQIQAALQQLATLTMPASGTAGTRLSDDQKAATKAADLTPIQQIARATMPELYGQKGSKR